jgi:hypothetical protein
MSRAVNQNKSVKGWRSLESRFIIGAHADIIADEQHRQCGSLTKYFSRDNLISLSKSS